MTLRFTIVAALMVILWGTKGNAGEEAESVGTAIEPDHALGLNLLQCNVGYIKANYTLLQRIDALIEQTEETLPEYEALLAKQYEIVTRIDFFEQRNRTLIKDYELFDNPYVHVGDSNREFRLRIPGADLAKLRKLSQDRKISMTQLVMDALREQYWK